MEFGHLDVSVQKSASYGSLKIISPGSPALSVSGGAVVRDGSVDTPADGHDQKAA